MKENKMTTKLKYVDIHGHINFDDYNEDRVMVYERAQKAGVGHIAVGTTVESSQKAVELAVEMPNVWASVGIHPTEKVSPKDLEQITSLANENKVVAIGECGLDLFHCKEGDFEAQVKVFEEHIAIANKVNKPLMLHIRGGKNKTPENESDTVYAKALKILNNLAKVRANFHFFAGNLKDLKLILDAGHSISFTGVITFTRDYDELIKYAPLHSIMSETDCPFVAPQPFRGKRNEPVYVIETVKAMARIRGEDEVFVSQKLLENAKNFFNLVF